MPVYFMVCYFSFSFVVLVVFVFCNNKRAVSFETALQMNSLQTCG